MKNLTVRFLVIVCILALTSGCATFKINNVDPSNPTANKQEGVNEGFWSWCENHKVACTAVLAAGGTAIVIGVKKLTRSSKSTPAAVTTTTATEGPAEEPAEIPDAGGYGGGSGSEPPTTPPDAGGGYGGSEG